MKAILDAILMRRLAPGWQIAGKGLLGLFTGLFLVVAYISNAASYLSDDPRACVNCHIMRPEYVTWQHSSHGRVTSCNDCHVPHDSVARKYVFKANDGLRHSALFTLRREHQVIQAISESRNVIQANCIRCHSRVMDHTGSFAEDDTDRFCIDCHREVPHGRVHSLSSTPNAPIPPLSPVLPDWLVKEGKQ